MHSAHCLVYWFHHYVLGDVFHALLVVVLVAAVDMAFSGVVVDMAFAHSKRQAPLAD